MLSRFRRSVPIGHAADPPASPNLPLMQAAVSQLKFWHVSNAVEGLGLAEALFKESCHIGVSHVFLNVLYRYLHCSFLNWGIVAATTAIIATAVATVVTHRPGGTVVWAWQLRSLGAKNCALRGQRGLNSLAFLDVSRLGFSLGATLPSTYCATLPSTYWHLVEKYWKTMRNMQEDPALMCGLNSGNTP